MKYSRGRRTSPEEGAQVRAFVEDVVRATLDGLLELGYLQRVEGGHGQERRGPEGSAPLTEPEWFATMDVLSDVMSRL